MTWIRTIPPDRAKGELKEIYEKTKSPHGTYDNVYISKSLRPQTILGHDLLYRAVLHHPDKVSYLGEDLQKKAKEKFQIINNAYQAIKDERNIA